MTLKETSRRVRQHLSWQERRVHRKAVSVWSRTTAPARALPNFFVIGGQKCGSSALWSYIAQHPAIGGYAKQEVHYFDLNYERGLRWYRSHFPFRTAARKQVGEATPGYIFHPLVPARIREFDGDAKLIAVLRDPVDRALSHYHELRALGIEQLTFEEALDREAERLAGEAERMLADPAYPGLARMWFSYTARGLYLEQLERWWQHFPHDRLLVLSNDDLATDPAGTVGRAFAFLGLPPAPGAEYPRVNVRKYEAMSDETRDRLARLFEGPNRRLYERLGRDFGWTRPV